MMTVPRFTFTSVTLIALALVAPSVLGAPMSGGTAAEKNIRVSQAVVRLMPPGATNTAGYMTIRSRGVADTLLRAAVPASLARRTELHRSMMIGGQMTMVPQKRISIPRNGTRVLAMGGFHLMIMGLQSPLTAGGRVPLTLTFHKAGRVRVSAPIVAM